MNKWDIVLLTYPFTDLSATKVRPALVISLLITTNTARRTQYDIIISRTHPEFSLTGLRYDSAIRTDKIFALSKKLVTITLGRCGQQMQREVEKRLRLFLDLPGDQLPLNVQV